MKNIKQFYKELGKVAYAVAMADGYIQPEEMESLHEFVAKDLSNNENTTDSSGMNQAFYVDFEFEKSMEEHLNTTEAVKSFVRFLHNNYEEMDKALIKRSVELLERIASVFSKKSEKEVISLVKAEISEVSRHIF